MPNLAKLIEPKVIGLLSLTVTRGVTAGWIAGLPQVLVAQAEAQALGIRERADIGPRFVRQAARHAGSSLSTPMQWMIGGVFHFEYAAIWGALYGLIVESLDSKRVPPLLSGSLLGAIIYAAAFSSLGAASRTGSEREVERRPVAEHLLHWSSALSFGLTAAVSYRWLRERW